MIQGLIAGAMHRPTLHDRDGAATAGGSATMGRMENAMQAAGNPQRHATREEQARRQWMGNWVSTGQGEGQREPGDLFGSQPPRQAMGIAEGLRERITQRYQNVANQTRQPYGTGAGGVLTRNLDGTGNLTHALSARNAPQSIASLNSAAQAADSLAAHGMNLHPGRRR